MLDFTGVDGIFFPPTEKYHCPVSPTGLLRELIVAAVRQIRDHACRGLRVAQLVKAYHNDEIRRFIDTQFKGSVVAGW